MNLDRTKIPRVLGSRFRRRIPLTLVIVMASTIVCYKEAGIQASKDLGEVHKALENTEKELLSLEISEKTYLTTAGAQDLVKYYEKKQSVGKIIDSLEHVLERSDFDQIKGKYQIWVREVLEAEILKKQSILQNPSDQDYLKAVLDRQRQGVGEEFHVVFHKLEDIFRKIGWNRALVNLSHVQKEQSRLDEALMIYMVRGDEKDLKVFESSRIRFERALEETVSLLRAAKPVEYIVARLGDLEKSIEGWSKHFGQPQIISRREAGFIKNSGFSIKNLVSGDKNSDVLDQIQKEGSDLSRPTCND